MPSVVVGAHLQQKHCQVHTVVLSLLPQKITCHKCLSWNIQNLEMTASRELKKRERNMRAGYSLRSAQSLVIHAAKAEPPEQSDKLCCPPTPQHCQRRCQTNLRPENVLLRCDPWQTSWFVWFYFWNHLTYAEKQHLQLYSLLQFLYLGLTWRLWALLWFFFFFLQFHVVTKFLCLIA